MTKSEFDDAVIDWHRDQGGFGGNPAGHALRMLREVVELCIACGARQYDIHEAVAQELVKAIRRDEMGKQNVEHMLEETADVDMLFTIFQKYFIPYYQEWDAREAKFEVVKARRWEVDSDGVLWRPGTKPAVVPGASAESS